MFGIDTRAARVTWTVSLIVLTFYLLFVVRKTLMIFVLALFLAYMIAPLVRAIERRKQARVPRTVSVAAAFVLIVGLIAIGATLIAPAVSDEAQLLSEKLPQLAQQAKVTNIP